MFKRLGLLCSIFSFFTLFAQSVNTVKLVLTQEMPEGVVRVYQFNESVYHVRVQLHGLTHQENISNAVIATPKPYGMSDVVRNADHIAIGAFRLSGLINTNQQRGLRLRLGKEERIFGAGERAIPQNRRGYRLDLNNNPWYGYAFGAENLNFSVPFILSSEGYAVLFDNPARGYLDIGKTNTDVLEYGASSGEVNCYVILGKTYPSILQQYHQLTGTQPIPPRWAFGNFVSRFGYRSDAQVRDVVARMKKDKFPMDALVFDLFWFGDSIQHTLGNLDWVNRKAWPDPKRLLTDLSAQKINPILITEPFILKDTRNFNSALPYLAKDSSGKPFMLTDFYFGYGGLLDVFRKDAQEWMWQHYAKQIGNGAKAWWTDLGEPEKHPSGVLHDLRDLGFNRLFGADEVHNMYGHYWNKMLFEQYAKHFPDTRLFHLNRSGYAGSQRYSIFPWTGDISRTWEGFKAQMPILLGMSLSGVPYIHSDAGGFAMVNQDDPELYLRWLQFAAFTPVFRPHGTALEDITPPNTKSVPSEPTFYPEPYKKAARNVIRFRYDLTPYNYTLAYEQAVNGKPLIRPMFYSNPTDSNAYKAEQQFMWGDALLVAPVIEKGAVTKQIYFPEGKWYDWMRNKSYTGGAWITDSVALNELAVFAREGSFVPTVWGFTNLEDYHTKDLNVVYFPSAKATSYTMYDDDGLTNKSWEKGAFELIEFNGQQLAASTKISIASTGGNFKGQPEVRNLRLYVADLAKKPQSVMVNGQAYKLQVYTKGRKTMLQKGYAVYYPDTRMLTVVTQLKTKSALQVSVR